MNTAVVIALIVCGTIVALAIAYGIFAAINMKHVRKSFKDFNDTFKDDFKF